MPNFFLNSNNCMMEGIDIELEEGTIFNLKKNM